MIYCNIYSRKGQWMNSFLMKLPISSEHFLDLLKAILADALAAEENDIICIGAEYAGGLIFLKDYSVFVGKDLEGVLFVDVHCLSDAYGEYDSAELVYFSCDTC